MKTKSILVLTAAAVAFAFVLSSCGGSKKEDSSDEHTDHATTEGAIAAPAGPLFEVDNTFKEQLVRVFQSYLKIKDSFVESDPAAVKTGAADLKAILRAFDTKMLSGQALNDWSNYSNNLDMALVEMVSSDDIEVQRTSFSALSENMYKSVKAYGLGGPTAYYEYCPMAFNDQGGYWLSDSKEIRNPYFGHKMLTCGRVTEELN